MTNNNSKKLELSFDENEIEYFGFLPISFVLELQNALEVILGDAFKSKKYKYLKNTVTAKFDHYAYFFGNFVLRNILKFPTGFKWERKKTNKVIDVDLVEQVNQLVKLQQLNQNKIQILQQKEHDLVNLININNGLKCTQKSCDKIVKTAELQNELEKQLDELEVNFSYFTGNNKNKQRRLKSIMEHKYIKSQFYKEERKRLLKIAKTVDLEEIVKKMINN